MSVLQPPTTDPDGHPAVGGPFAHASVLVIDDDERVSNTLSALLKAEGFDVVIAHSGEEGVELLRARPFEAVISDLMMPGMSGIQTIAGLKEVDPDVQVIILTGEVTMESAIAAVRVGASDFLPKPISIAQLRPALLRTLENRRAEATRAQARARAVIEAAREAIVLFDREGVIRDFNPAAEQIFGCPRMQAVGKRLADFAIPPRLFDVFRKHLDTAYREGKDPAVGCLEVHALRRNGEEFPLEISTAVVATPQGKLLSTFARDITERRRAEEMLQLTQFSMEHASDAIFWINPRGRIVYVNESACRSLGRSREELLSLSIPDIDPNFPPEAWTSTWAKIKAFGSMNLETHHQTKLGRLFPVEVSSNYLAFGGKEFSFAFARDITERKRAEEEMRASEERYRELFENASDIVYTTGLDTRLTSLNRVGQSVLGYSAEEAMQLDLRQLVVPEHWETVEQSRKRLGAGDSDVTTEMEMTCKDGRRIRLEVKACLIYRGGDAVGVQAIARDITGREAAEMELRHAQKLESVGRLASGIAHEINTPIQFVGDNARFLQDSFGGLQALIAKYQILRDAADRGAVGPQLLAEVREAEETWDCSYLMEEIPKALAQTLDGVTRVATIVRAVKEFAHPENKEIAAADLNRALLSTLTVARNELKYVADVETEFGDLPRVLCNVGDLNQVFLNLLVNAAHAIGDSVKGTEQRGKIRVRTASEGETVLVTISDTGCGIPEANRSRVFDPFFTTKEVGRGTGQGLAIARSVVVDRHKGTLTFESEVGKGTTFYIRLPIDPREYSREAKVL